MKPLFYPAVWLLVVAGCGAAPLGLELPSLTYKDNPSPLFRPFFSQPPAISQDAGDPHPIVRPKSLRQDHSRPSNFDLGIITPKPGIDYKLRIVNADPTIDPKMLFPRETSDQKK